jgi:ABC-2 type transport system ATP-binding protein
VADHLRLGAHLNPGWDAAMAKARIEPLNLDPSQRSAKMSGGHRAQLALTLAMAKRPRLLILDEPIASLDPLARLSHLIFGLAGGCRAHGCGFSFVSWFARVVQLACSALHVSCLPGARAASHPGHSRSREGRWQMS